MAVAGATTIGVFAQRGVALSPEQAAQRWETEKELQSIAVVERKVMMPMRDGVRLATDIYRPKNTAGKVPTIFVRTPYNFNYWDVRNGVPRDMNAALDGRQARLRLRRPERARPFLLGRQLRHPRPADRTATTRSNGCRSSRGPTARSARPAARRPPNGRWRWRRWAHPAFAAMNVQGFGAGVGRVGAVLRAGQLVSRRRGADAVHRLALRRAEPGAPDVSAEHARRKI